MQFFYIIFNMNEEMETENLSTAASRFGLRSATELAGDKEPRPAPKPAAVATHCTFYSY